ncbi:hypothetical protein RIR_jg37452.t3 [Rhizophagus irregularis DAOM 181602=DAOM 197198]|nr:hypothetical protein RIR_jg1897.t3 [Rhizophagus irregularis DAOM 181602=DAOM 197198]GET58205.1 hypothetical protein RIR_jg37452.t3 [Rhizophagus irregularis DAOM 181602=DAOM 197198]
MDLYVYNLDEYTTDSRQGNEFAPSWPFRLAVAGSSDSGKTTMIINLLMGDKKAKEDGERYILCDAVILVGRYLDEPKWAVVRDFFKEEEIPFTAVSHSEIPNVKDFNSTQATVVIFEDLMDVPKKTQDLITGFFTHGRHKNISCIYVALRFFTIPKAIRENVNYISLHGDHGSLTDTKRIIRLYTEESESLAPVIDDLTLQREFVVFDLRRSKSDPLSIRVRWDTSLSSITDQSQFDPSSNSVQSPFDPSLNPVRSKFSPYGQKAVAEAKKSSQLIEFAREYPSPKERKHLLVSGIIAKNADTWIKYVFREAYGLSGKTLGSDFQKFLAKVRDRTAKTEIPKSETVKELFFRYEVLKSSHPLDNKKIIEGIGVLLQIFSKGHMDRRALRVGINSIL